MFHRLDSLAVAEMTRSLVSARAAQGCPLVPAQVRHPDPMVRLVEVLLEVLVEASVRPSRRRLPTSASVAAGQQCLVVP